MKAFCSTFDGLNTMEAFLTKKTGRFEVPLKKLHVFAGSNELQIQDNNQSFRVIESFHLLISKIYSCSNSKKAMSATSLCKIPMVSLSSILYTLFILYGPSALDTTFFSFVGVINHHQITDFISMMKTFPVFFLRLLVDCLLLLQFFLASLI